MLVPMRRVEIIAPRSDADALLPTLHRIGTVQLLPYVPDSSLAATVRFKRVKALRTGVGVGVGPASAR